jgi:hypothetical protein
MDGIHMENELQSKPLPLMLQIGVSMSTTVKPIIHAYCFSIGSTKYKVERLGIKAPSYKIHNTSLVEVIGQEGEMVLHNVQCTQPDGSMPVVENISCLEM